MDVTNKTVDSDNLLSNETALKNDGTNVVGGIVTKSSSDLTASGATVTAPAGYYAQAASKSVASGTAGTPTATKGAVSNHSVTITPSVTNTAGYISGGTKNGTAVTVSVAELVSGTKTISSSGETDVTNYASASVADGSATTPTTSITANPTISVSASGLITATASASKSVTPTVSAGYVASGTAGTVSVSGSNTQQLSTQAATTITPSTTTQTAVAAGKYTTGAVTVGPIPPQYIVPSGTKEITENGTGIDVSSYAAVDVAVPGQEPTGVKYIYTDIDGEGAWDIGGYAKCSVNGAPVNDGETRLTVKVDANDTISINVSKKQTIDWGDGTTTPPSSSSGYVIISHTYINAGYYRIIANPISPAYRLGNNVFADDNSKQKAVSVEINCDPLGASFKVLNANSFADTTTRIALIIANTIESRVFENCTNLATVIIENSANTSIDSIRDYAFYGCSSLTKFTIKAETPPTLGIGVFTGASESLAIYVPYSADHSILAAYQSATNWSTWASYMQEEPQ